MTRLLTITLLLLSTTIFSQEQNKDTVAEVVKTFFEGFHESDKEKMLNTLHDNFTMQSVFKNKEGATQLTSGDAMQFVTTVAERAKKEQWTEKITEYKTQNDGLLATVWTPYKFYLGDQYLHCGVNVFTLMKVNNDWKIISIIDTRKKECHH